jgi:hypothetical protein
MNRRIPTPRSSVAGSAMAASMVATFPRGGCHTRSFKGEPVAVVVRQLLAHLLPRPAAC